MVEDSQQNDFVSDREKWITENGFRERELKLKEEDLRLKREEQKASGWRSPLVVAILGATLAGAGNAIVAIVNGTMQRDLEDRNGTLQRELEDRKAEQTRILEMIKTGDPDRAAANLDFLLESGLISDPERASKLKSFLSSRQPGTGPNLPPANALFGSNLDEAVRAEKLPPSSQLAISTKAVGRLDYVSQGAIGSCTAFLVAKDLALTAASCISDRTGAQSAKLRFPSDQTGVTYNVELVERTGELGYALLKVPGDPGLSRGFLRLSQTTPKVGESLAVVMFREQDEKIMVVTSSHRCSVSKLEGDAFFYECSTRTGSGGSPILDATGREVVGLHIGRRVDGAFAMSAEAIRRLCKQLTASH